MKRNISKWISIVLASVMVVTMAPVQGVRADEVQDSSALMITSQEESLGTVDMEDEADHTEVDGETDHTEVPEEPQVTEAPSVEPAEAPSEEPAVISEITETKEDEEPENPDTPEDPENPDDPDIPEEPDWDTLKASAEKIGLSEKTVSDCEDIAVFKFTASETATYKFGSSGSADTVGTLVDGKRTVLAENDNKNSDGKNFQIVYDVKKGATVYLLVTEKNKGTFSTKVSVSFLLNAPSARTAISTNGIKVSWRAVNNTVNSAPVVYRVYRKGGGDDWKKIAQVSGTSFVDKKVKSGTIYRYRVRCYNKKTSMFLSTTGESSATRYLSKITPSVSNISSGVSVKWTPVKGAKGYNIYRKTNGNLKLIDTVKGSSKKYYKDTTVKSGTTYKYAVRAYNGDYEGLSAVKTTKYLAPTSVSFKNTVSGLKVKWKSVKGANGYHIYRKIKGGAYKKIGTAYGANATSYTDKNVVSGTTYTYRVKAYNGKYEGGCSGKYYRYLKAIKPSLKNEDDGINVSWSKVGGAAGYYVYRRAAGGSYKQIATIKNSNTTSYRDTAVSDGTVYHYTVKAYWGRFKAAARAQETVRISRLNIKGVTTKEGMIISWDANSKASGYQVQYAANDAFSDAHTATLNDRNATEKKFEGLESEKVYYARARAFINHDGKTYYSSWSVVLKGAAL